MEYRLERARGVRRAVPLVLAVGLLTGVGLALLPDDAPSASATIGALATSTSTDDPALIRVASSSPAPNSAGTIATTTAVAATTVTTAATALATTVPATTAATTTVPATTAATTTVPATTAATTTGPSPAAVTPRTATAATTIAATTVPPTTAATTTAAPTTVAPTATTTAPSPAQPIAPPSDPRGDEERIELGRISIPTLGVDEPLLEGIRLTTLDVGPGHWPGTALPGQVGNVVVAGHRVSHGGPFRHIDQLIAGDTVEFTTAAGHSTYVVTGTQIVEPDAVWIVSQTATPTATLFACHPPGSVSQRIVVNLELAS